MIAKPYGDEEEKPEMLWKVKGFDETHVERAENLLNELTI